VKLCVLVSGGLDSVTALHHAARRHTVVGALSFDYGAKHNHRELPCAEAQCARLGVPHRIIRLPFVNEFFRSDLLQSGGEIPEGHYAEETMQRTVVPFRNGIMLAIAAGFAESAGAQGLVIAAHAGDHAIYPDCRPRFLAAMGEAIREGTYARLEIVAPFSALDKAAIVREGRELGVDFSLTWSCYKGQALHCGRCGTCVERREAFLRAGIADPTPYQSTPPLPPAPVAAARPSSSATDPEA
jgi:7-cyano-7-deazaguanine synthase